MINTQQAAGEETCDIECVHPQQVSAVLESLLSDDATERLAQTFGALSDRTRVKIIHALSLAELCVCDLSYILGLSQSATSHQLRLLRGLRLVKNRREGRMVFYSLDDAHILNLFDQGLRHVAEESGCELTVRREMKAGK